ncbi:hypothetical protein MSG28_011164 [Choristoneura fumiferana]|uniref:Uncharacterized protein n=1 Tax=Choristoneura fumiferana TaxID=7141 RepID=A0ACC0KQB4_CHOFU|nr:hypothetical protein MSG28_011164 [Choristoneura fumiferana]
MRLALCALLLLLPAPAPAWRSDTVKAWSRALGEELWGLKVALTKSDQIKAKYKEMNASVKRKNGRQILDSSLESVATMLTKKINAVKCIHATAKQLVREFQLNNETVDANFTYCSAKYSNFTYEDGSDLKRDSDKLPNFVKKEQLHYLPSNLERDSHFYNISAQNAIVWSKGLNDIFTRNYQADPSLAWQYFGTANGILRFYPGMPWNMKETDIYDCRVQSWYIEAATCSKDIIVLFDVSGSMTGFKNYVARTTLKSLLDTLSNNDYVNVYAFKNDTHLVMNCSEGLVQATKENIGTILHTLTPTDGGKKHKILLEGNANLTKAYIKAFEMLKVLVMLITDYVPGNLSEVFDEYNREVVDGKTYIPVRVFTYLIGKERTKTWGVISDISKHDEDKLVTSVAIPAFDSESNQDAILIGVAGTDVPIDSIAKLGQPHQLGVNGYSFIVSNNGYLLLHPLLKTSINEELQVNYNSVDFVEVEQVDDGKGARELGDKILGLRQNLTDGDDGNMTDVEVLFHYDDMRRISRVKHDYYFRGLNETPFSMGISLPKGYGDTELMLKDNPLEATQGQSLTGINGHESDNPEIEIWKFLVNISKNLTDISKKQYTKEASETFSVENDYYCNEDLVKQLVFDAKLSAPYFQEWTDHTAYEEELAKKYNVSVRFIMTSSGLTRWHYLYDDDKNEQVNETGSRLKNFGGKVLGDHYSTTIEVTPYKAAVLQSTINRESLVVATPLPVLDTTIVNPTPVIQDGDITITASYAIFYKDSNIETPASVVGFQFSYLHFRDRFMKIIESVDDKSLSCNNKDYECYVIDSSGYIVLSMAMEEVGQFFGMVQPYVLKSFIEKKIFEHVEVFNYQALCPLSILKQSANDSWLLDTPWSLIKWFLTELLLIVSDIYSWNTYTHANSIVEDAEQGTTNAPPKNEKAPPGEKTFSCDHSITLYILNQTHFLKTVEASPIVYEEKFGKCHPPYWASYVKNTNLLLVVVEKNDNAMFDDDQKCLPPPMTNPVPTNDSIQSSEPCHKLNLAKLPRRRLEGFTYMTVVEKIELRGWAVKLGTELYHFGEFITRKKEVQDSFKSAQIESRDGEKLVQSMADDIRAMMELKISAVKRIVEAAENMAFDKQSEPVPEDYQFYNSKEMDEPYDDVSITTTAEPDFTLENWIVRPPTKSAHLQLNAHFYNIPVNTNFSTMKWRADPVDIYDCRTRAWYMEAAASPKDVVILVDRSGSMTGQRRDISKHVVTNILDTLGNNDFVNATMGNLRELKLGLDNFETKEIANFSAALTRAFELLEIYRNNSGGANCNQAIMLVTDGVPYNYKELFEKYNWKYDTPVRVFTYLIGREVADVREVKWMACANRGFYVHLSTLAEVRERVLEHVNVLARPLVLQRETHPVVWTPVYANITQRERAEQKERFMSQRRDKSHFNSEKEQERRWRITQMKQGQYSELGNSQYQLMTSVSMPVYDLRHNENITENVLINEAYWVSVTKEMRIARLLGVAGTDVALSEMQALMTPYKIGVNGYAFIVTNNGYILIHPDLRPVQILKPSYNSVDMIELRQEIIDQKTGNKLMNSPFTLVVAIPENYGRHRITPPPTDDIHRVSLTTKNISAQQYLNDRWSRSFSSPEEELSYFLERVARPGWRWPAKPRPPEHHKNKPAHERHNGDHGLMQALLYDARNTAWFNKSISESASEEKAAEFIQRFGYIVAFLATHSGLTRWQTHPPKEHDNSNDSKSEFGKKYPRAIDEAWYRRAVEQHYVDPLSYVYSVAVVTAAHAVFHGDGHRKAPAAVVGFQFRHDRLSDEDDTQTGQFFGKIRPDVMSMLVEEEVYKTIHIMDYQAVCFREKKTTNPASILLTPLENLRLIMAWFLATSVWLYNSIAVGLAQGTSYFDEVSYTYENDEETDDPFKSQPPTRIIERDFEKMVLINRTRPTPCDREMFLYQLEYNNLDEKLNKPAKDCERPFYAQLVNYTNMLLVVVDGNCPREDAPVLSVDATEVQYNGTLQCLKHVHPLYRKQPVSCIRNHPEESNIDMCGRGSIPERSVFWIPLTMVMVFRYF